MKRWYFSVKKNTKYQTDYLPYYTSVCKGIQENPGILLNIFTV